MKSFILQGRALRLPPETCGSRRLSNYQLAREERKG